MPSASLAGPTVIPARALRRLFEEMYKETKRRYQLPENRRIGNTRRRASDANCWGTLKEKAERMNTKKLPVREGAS